MTDFKIQDRKFTIVPENINGSNKDNYTEEQLIRPSYAYLHGLLETENGYDIFSMVKSEFKPNEIELDKWVSDELKEGVYSCIFKNQECTLFRWFNRHFKGLVVLNSDKESFEYAAKCYKTKQIVI